jgi:pentatricopeptide repeat protein
MQLLASTPELQTLETFNAMMSCYAERGDTYDVLALLDNLLLKGISPDCNSYSFAIEALGKNIHRWKKHHNPGLVQENMELADRILGMMETNQIWPSTDFIRNYVELLCIAGESKTADLVVDDMLEKFPKSVCSKALYRLAITNTENGDFERARELASRITDDIPTLMTKIRSREQRVYHVNRTAKVEWTMPRDGVNFDAAK